MKKLMLISGFLILYSFVTAQAKNGNSELNLALPSEQAALIFLPYSPEVVTAALAGFTRIMSKKYKPTTQRYVISSRTLLVRNNPGADMHFLIGARGPLYFNETALYLKLHSSSFTEDDYREGEVNFTMEEAIAYLNNFALAIESSARIMQISLQTDNLKDAKKNEIKLSSQGDKLKNKQKNLKHQIETTGNKRKIARLNKETLSNEHKIEKNRIEQSNQGFEIIRQKASLTLLINPVI